MHVWRWMKEKVFEALHLKWYFSTDHPFCVFLCPSPGPEPPTELLFSNITETSLTVSWTKPKSTVTGFKVTYTNSANGTVEGSNTYHVLCLWMFCFVTWTILLLFRGDRIHACWLTVVPCSHFQALCWFPVWN